MLVICILSYVELYVFKNCLREVLLCCFLLRVILVIKVCEYLFNLVFRDFLVYFMEWMLVKMWIWDIIVMIFCKECNIGIWENKI